MSPPSSAVASFRALHASGCFVMSALYLQHLGFKARQAIETGAFDSLASAAPFSELHAVFGGRRPP